jgi:hypothetical protein
MRKIASALGWIALLVGAAMVAVWAQPRAYPLLFRHATITRDQATAIALARLGALGDLPVDRYVVPLGRELVAWETTVYAPGRRSNDWSYRAKVASNGELLALRLRLPDEQAGAGIDPGTARARASEWLVAQGFDLSRYLEPEIKTEDKAARTDTTVRFRGREQLFGDRLRYGVEVVFAGDRLAGFDFWFEDPNQKQVDALAQPYTLIENLRFFTIFLLFPIVGVFFVRRYHEGVVGVDRSLRIFALSVGIGLVFLPMVARGATQEFAWTSLSREQWTAFWGVQMAILYFVPQALVSALSWSVGESLCREHWGRKLAAFDAALRRDFANRTVAVATLRGLALGVAMAALLLAYVALAPRGWGRGMASVHLGPWWPSARWPGLTLVMFSLCLTLYFELFGRLFLVPLLVRRLGKIGGGVLAAVLGGLIFWGPVALIPMSTSVPIGLAWSGVLVFLFLRYDFMTSTVASFSAQVVVAAMPFVLADGAGLRAQGWLALLVAALPCLATLRHLGSEREFVYRYEDVPPHVRRIAERERQRVELETARNIQSSILPELPAQLNGVELAHSYLPATAGWRSRSATSRATASARGSSCRWRSRRWRSRCRSIRASRRCSRRSTGWSTRARASGCSPRSVTPCSIPFGARSSSRAPATSSRTGSRPTARSRAWSRSPIRSACGRLSRSSPRSPGSAPATSSSCAATGSSRRAGSRPTRSSASNGSSGFSRNPPATAPR